jgi:hypothetical protein
MQASQKTCDWAPVEEFAVQQARGLAAAHCLLRDVCGMGCCWLYFSEQPCKQQHHRPHHVVSSDSATRDSIGPMLAPIYSVDQPCSLLPRCGGVPCVPQNEDYRYHFFVLPTDISIMSAPMKLKFPEVKHFGRCLRNAANYRSQSSSSFNLTSMQCKLCDCSFAPKPAHSPRPPYNSSSLMLSIPLPRGLFSPCRTPSQWKWRASLSLHASGSGPETPNVRMQLVPTPFLVCL